MVRLEDILNHSDEGSETPTDYGPTKSLAMQSKSHTSTSVPGSEDSWELNKARRSIPRSKISKRHLKSKNLVQISIRRKSTSRKGLLTENTPGISKLHFKYLEAGLRVKLTMVPSLFALYNSLMPHTNKKQVYMMREQQAVEYNISEEDSSVPRMAILGRNMSSKSLQLIDNNLVNLKGYSNKVLQSFSLKKGHESSSLETSLPTFNSLDTAVSSLFGVTEYTLVRVTRSTSNDHEGSVLLKLETAKPGDYSLIDNEEFAEEMIHSIGKINDTPNNLFIKKIVARPRYKSDMKIFLIPYSQNISLYVDERMFERDLINSVIDIDLLPSSKDIFCSFNFNHIVRLYKNLLSLTRLDEKTNPNISMGVTDSESAVEDSS